MSTTPTPNGFPAVMRINRSASAGLTAVDEQNVTNP